MVPNMIFISLNQMEEAAYAESRPVCPISIAAHVAVQEHAAPMTFARVDDDVSLDTPLSAETALCRRCGHQRHSAQWRPRHALWMSRKLESGWT